jgi:hypothetical protein
MSQVWGILKYEAGLEPLQMLKCLQRLILRACTEFRNYGWIFVTNIFMWSLPPWATALVPISRMHFLCYRKGNLFRATWCIISRVRKEENPFEETSRIFCPPLSYSLFTNIYKTYTGQLIPRRPCLNLCHISGTFIFRYRSWELVSSPSCPDLPRMQWAGDFCRGNATGMWYGRQPVFIPS